MLNNNSVHFYWFMSHKHTEKHLMMFGP